MPTPTPSAPLESRARYWRRVLRPLLWWLLLVLVLYGIRLHQRWMEQTRLTFTASLAGQTPFPEAMATFDGKPIFSGQKIPLGQHHFAVTHPKGESFSTNFFIWYGAHNLGPIDLKRTMSLLSVTANPPAPVLYIHGLELDLTLTNSPGMTSSVPTDRYVIMSRYAHWSRSDEVLVSPGVPAAWWITPRLGAAQITCNQADATGQFMQADGQIIEAVTFPYSISELPEGTYHLTAQHHNDVLSQTVNIAAGMTNQLSLEFLYGAALLETEPPGATVQTGNGRYWGVTPLKLTEMKPGTWTFALQHDGYEAVAASLAISANQSTSFHTNLISVTFTGSMKAARQAMDNEDYDGALKAVGAAIIAKPGDADALTLQNEAQSRLKVKQQRSERLDQIKQVFDRLCTNNPDANLFDEHQLKAAQSAKNLKTAILNSLQADPKSFLMVSDSSPAPDVYQMTVRQSSSLGILGDETRMCLLVLGQVNDDETMIYFKVLEYRTQGPASAGDQSNPRFIPVHPSRFYMITASMQAQLASGVKLVTQKIQQAIGQP